MGELPTAGYVVNNWSGGQPTATWYDKHGRSFVLPSDPYSIEHYQDRGLSLHPPESPELLVVDYADRREGSIGATMGGIVVEEPKQPSEELFGGIPFVEEPERKGRGPDKKPRKKRRKNKRKSRC